MSKTATETVTLSLTSTTLRKLVAFTEARNGTIHNQADAAISYGIAYLVSRAPHSLQQTYADLLTAKEAEG